MVTGLGVETVVVYVVAEINQGVTESRPREMMPS